MDMLAINRHCYGSHKIITLYFNLGHNITMQSEETRDSKAVRKLQHISLKTCFSIAVMYFQGQFIECKEHLCGNSTVHKIQGKTRVTAPVENQIMDGKLMTE